MSVLHYFQFHFRDVWWAVADGDVSGKNIYLRIFYHFIYVRGFLDIAVAAPSCDR